MSNDKKIKELLKTIEEKRAKLGEKPKAAWMTNCLIPSGKAQVRKNLNVISENECLLSLSELIAMRKFVGEASEILGIDFDIKETPIEGFSYQDWEHDFKLRVKIIQWNEEKSKLSAMEAKLKELRSEEAKTADAIDDIVNALK